MNSQSPEDSLHRSERYRIESEVVRLAQESADRHSPTPAKEPVDRLDSAEIAKLTAALAILGGEAKLIDSADASEAFRLGRFEVRGERGRGGFGIVLRAFDPDLQREVALKLPRPERLLAGDNPEEILREARLAAQLDHSGIVPVYEIGQWGPVWYIASAYCPGPSLGEWLRSGSARLSQRGAVQLVEQICHAVQHAHSRGVLHLDLKPDNILLKEEAEQSDRLTPLVTDFGLSHSRRSPDGTPSRVGGTRDYMAPEQRRGDIKNIGVASDVFALGAMLQELLTVSKTSESVQQVISKDLQAIIQKCLAEDPIERYLSAQDLASDLGRYQQGEVLHARPVAWPHRASRWARRRPALAGALMLLLATLATSFVTFGYLWRRAEGYLLNFKQEVARRQVADDRIEASVLSLAGVAQKSQLHSTDRDSLSSSELQSLRDYLVEMRDWQSNQPNHSKRRVGIDAALHSLALVESVDSVLTPELQLNYREGLQSWQMVLRSDPSSPQLRRALAAHILTYHLRDPQRKWLEWRKSEQGLHPDSIAIIELPYAELLIELAARQLRRRGVDPSHGMLAAAIEILKSQSAKDLANQSHLLLAAHNLSAQAAKLLSRSSEVAHHREAADLIVASADNPCRCSNELALPIAETLEMQSLEHYRAGDLEGSIQLLAIASGYVRHSSESEDIDFSSTLELAHLLGRKADYLRKNTQELKSIAAYQQAIEVFDSALSRTSVRPRVIIARRGMLQRKLGRGYLELGDDVRATQTLEAAARDFTEISLRQVDSKGTWIASVLTLQSLGKLYAAAGRKAESRRAYNQSLARLALMRSFTRHPSVATYTKAGQAAIAKL